MMAAMLVKGGCKVADTGWQVHRVTSPIGKLLDPGVRACRHFEPCYNTPVATIHL